MSTTRHLVNRRRRLAAAESPRPKAKPDPEQAATARTESGAARTGGAALRTSTRPRPVREREREREEEAAEAPEPRRIPRAAAVLGALAVLLGCFAGLAAVQAGSAGGDADTANTALTDSARTSEVKGAVATAVNAVFSVNYADVQENETAAQKYLTGDAVAQHRGMLAPVKADAGKQKLVLTTTVTDSGVQHLEGDRARLLIFADQRNTRTDKDETTYAAAMFAVDAVRQDGIWKIANIDTFAR
ncbi:hypothetical protein AB0M28_05465 [Streptomyces sp. NPDC051940]|uniref:hypothetical protein n=1 Tax=Streptomyces sp. NPDC051940 TaxID=3155675 RepID=UPI003416C1AC